MKRQLDQYTHCGKLTRAILKFLCVLTTTVRSCATATSSDPPPYSQCNKDIMYYIIAGIPLPFSQLMLEIFSNYWKRVVLEKCYWNYQYMFKMMTKLMLCYRLS